MSDVDDEDHFLSPYLSRRLPELGLDYETYGPYCLGAVGSESSSSDGGGGGGRDDDYEELDGITDLLRSSSETHSDDAEAWADLRAEIIRRTGEWRRAAEVRKREETQKAKEAEEEKLRHAKVEAEAYEETLRGKRRITGVRPRGRRRRRSGMRCSIVLPMRRRRTGITREGRYRTRMRRRRPKESTRKRYESKVPRAGKVRPMPGKRTRTP